MFTYQRGILQQNGPFVKTTQKGGNNPTGHSKIVEKHSGRGTHQREQVGVTIFQATAISLRVGMAHGQSMTCQIRPLANKPRTILIRS